MRRFIATGVLVVSLLPVSPLLARDRDSRPTAEGSAGRITRVVLGYFTQLVRPKNPSAKKSGPPTSLGDWLSPPNP
jgi:hypothetical protein